MIRIELAISTLTPDPWSVGIISIDHSIDPEYIGRTLGETLNQLRAAVWVRPALLELRGIITLTVPPVETVPLPGGLVNPDIGHDSQALGVLSIHHEGKPCSPLRQAQCRL